MIKYLLLLTACAIILSGCVPKAGRKAQNGEEFVKGAVVAGFPNLPLYAGAKVLESYGSEGNFGASFLVNEELAKVANFYSTALTQAGWDYSVRRVSDTNYVYDIENSENAGTIIINTAADGEQTAITVSLEPR